MLSEQNADDIAVLAEKCEDISRILRELRIDMLRLGPASLELNFLKAESFLEYLATWAREAKDKHARQRGKEAAKIKREQIKNARKKNR